MKIKCNYFWFGNPDLNFHRLIMTMIISCILLFCGILDITAVPSFSPSVENSANFKNSTYENLSEIGSAMEQQKHISGKVTDEKGNPLVGVTVLVKGTTLGVITDASGKYKISNVPQDASLIFSFIGMTTQEIPSGGREMIDIVLKEVAFSLDEVVVIGYGTQKKSVVTGSISSISSKELENLPITRIEQALQGRASGVTVTANSGEPGSASTVSIRGITSINNSDPLFIVDGIYIDNGDINFLNQSDIESIEVLKDASSAAIYGAKAASGVIIVTTKAGKKGDLQINYNFYYGTQAPAKKLHLLDATEYATLRNESSLAAGLELPFPNPSSYGKGTDWQSTIFNDDARLQNHEMSISGGNDKSVYYTSFGYLNQDGIVSTSISNYKRYNFRLNTTHQVKKWLNFGNTISYTHTKRAAGFDPNTEFGGPLSSAVNQDPITPVIVTDPNVLNSNPYNNHPGAIITDDNGNPYGISLIVGQDMTNPLAFAKTQLGNYFWGDNIVGNVFMEIEPLPNLKIKSSLGGIYTMSGNESFTPLYYLSTSQSNLENTQNSREFSKTLTWNWSNIITYSRKINQHNFSGLIGTEAFESSGSGIEGTYIGLPVFNYQYSSMNFSIPPTNRIALGQESQPYSRVSYFGRLTYDYGGKYMVTGIVRIDGSSHFGSNNRFGTFPSASFGWVPSREKFWPENNIVNLLKLRAAYGVNGNDNLPPFRYSSTLANNGNYPFNENNIVIGYSPGAPSNPDLKWEQTVETDFGLDMTLFKDFNLTVDLYNKKTTGMLLAINLPGYVGASDSPYGNIADMKNSGIDFDLGYNKSIGAVNLNLIAITSYNKNVVTGIGVNDYLWGGGFQASAYEIARSEVGQSINSFYGFKSTGIFQTQDEVNSYVNSSGELLLPNASPGDFRWVDLNKDGLIDEADRTFLGKPVPSWTFGFNGTMTWKNFDFSFFAQGVSGNKIFQGLRRLDIITANYQTNALTRWTEPGSSNSYPRIVDGDPNSNFSNPSSFYLEDGAYLRLKNLQLGYSLPDALIKKMRIQKLRFYLTSNNLVTFTKYTGYDPEIGGGSYSIDRGIYPQARSFIFGVNLAF